MRHILLVIRNGSFAAAIAVGLAFGAAEALDGTPDVALLRAPCDTPPGSCSNNEDCDDECEKVQHYYGGTCDIPPGCCVCFDR